MNRENLLVVAIAMLIGLLGGYLIFSILSDKNKKTTVAEMPMGAGSPTDYARRIAEAEKIVEREPKNLNVWISLGNDYFDTEQPQKAVHAYGKALELDPSNPNVLTDQGVMYRKLGQYDKALANFDQALKLEPKQLQALYNMGVVYAVDLKQRSKALPIWERYLAIDSSSATATQVKSMIEQASSSPPPGPGATPVFGTK